MAGKLLSAREFAERVSVCPETVRRWARRGQIRPAGRTPGGQLRSTSHRLSRFWQNSQMPGPWKWRSSYLSSWKS